MLLRQPGRRRAGSWKCVSVCGGALRCRQPEPRHGRQRDHGGRRTLSEEQACRTQQADVALLLHRALGRVGVPTPEREKEEQIAQAEQNDPESPLVVESPHDRLRCIKEEERIVKLAKIPACVEIEMDSLGWSVSTNLCLSVQEEDEEAHDRLLVCMGYTMLLPVTGMLATHPYSSRRDSWVLGGVQREELPSCRPARHGDTFLGPRSRHCRR